MFLFATSCILTKMIFCAVVGLVGSWLYFEEWMMNHVVDLMGIRMDRLLPDGGVY